MCFFHIPIPNPLAYNTSDICRLVPRFFVFHVHIQHDPKQPKKTRCFRIKSPCNTPNPGFLPCRSAVFRHCRWCGDFGGWLQCQFGITHDPGGHVFKGLYGVLPGSAIEAHIDMFSPLILVLVYLTLSRWRAAFFFFSQLLNFLVEVCLWEVCRFEKEGTSPLLDFPSYPIHHRRSYSSCRIFSLSMYQWW